MMKGLTLWRPWDEPMGDGSKPIENRTWAPPKSIIGSLVALHAGGTYDRDAVPFIIERGYKLLTRAQSDATRRGHVTSVGRLVGAYNTAPMQHRLFDEQERARRVRVTQSRWYMGGWGWLFEEMVALERPVPCAGAQGLWTLPSYVEGLVRAQLR